MSFPLTLLVVFFAREILSFWGPEYSRGFISLIILALAQLINCTTGACGFMIMMSGRTKINLFNTLSALVLTIVLSIFLIPEYGILGAALSFGVVLSIVGLARLIEVYIIMKIHPFRFDYLKPVFAGGISIFILFFGKKLLPISVHPMLEMFFGFSVFVSVYVLILILMGLEEEDKFILTKIKDKFITKRNYPGNEKTSNDEGKNL